MVPAWSYYERAPYPQPGKGIAQEKSTNPYFKDSDKEKGTQG